MAQERLAPDAILAQTNLSGAVGDIDEDPDSADGAWLTAPGSNNDTAVRVSFPTPTLVLTVGSAAQEFRVLWRKTSHSTNPTGTIELYQNGSLISTLVSGETVSSTTGVVRSVTWDANGRTPSLIECRVSGAVGGGSPGNRASLEVGAIEWNVEGTVAVNHALSGSVAGRLDADAAGSRLAPLTASIASRLDADGVGTRLVQLTNQVAE